MELLGGNLIFSSFAQFFVLPLLGFLIHCSCIPLDPVPLASGSLGKQEGWGWGSRVVNIPC